MTAEACPQCGMPREPVSTACATCSFEFEIADDAAQAATLSAASGLDRRRIALAGGAMAVGFGVLLLIAVGILGVGADEPTAVDPSSLASPSASTHVPTSSPRPSSVPAQSGAPGWTEVATFGAEGGWDYVKAVVRSGDAFLAIGSRMEPLGGGHTTGYGHGRERAWTSHDGTIWDEVILGSEFDGVVFSGTVSAPGGGFVAHGWREAEPPDPAGLTTNAAWRSADGRTWSTVGTNLDPHLFVGKVVHGARGYLLLAPQTANQDPSLWLSSDAVHWDEVHHFSQNVHWTQVEDVGAGDEGFVALGVHINQDNTYRRFTLASADGREWFESISPFGPEDQQYRPPFVIGPLGADWVAAVGQLHDGPAIWFSANGLDWAAASVIGDAPDNYWPALVSSGGRVFLSTTGSFPDSYSTSNVWSSTDGRRWPQLDIGHAFVGGAEDGSDGTVLGGATYPNSDESSATFWLGPSD